MPELTVNGARHAFDGPALTTLAETLRDDLGLTGTKIACGEGHCGACTVLLDGAPALSCITLVHAVGEREVTTIEGLRDHPLVARGRAPASPRRGPLHRGRRPSGHASCGRPAEPPRPRARTAARPRSRA